MRTLAKYTLFLTKIHGFAFIFSFLFLGATPQISKVFAQDKADGIKARRIPREVVAIEGEYIIQFKTNKPLENIKKGNSPAWLSKLGKDVKINTSLSEFKIAHFKVANPASSGQWENLANILSSDPSIQYVEPNYMVYTNAVPSDPLVPEMWFLNNISAFKAWDKAPNGKDVIVAVIDSGSQFDHNDLKGNIWINKNEIRDNNIDDDKNGYVDDIVGWDFYAEDNMPYAELYPVQVPSREPGCIVDKTKKQYESHATHVAGTIAAMGNNDLGIVGVSSHVKIMPIRALGSPCGGGDTLSILEAVLYAANNGARIINLSIGGYQHLQTEESVFKAVSDKGILIVVSAGNESNNNDSSERSYPASYNADGILSVAATDTNDALAGFSNYGVKNVDIAAPGVSILSTYPYGENDPPKSGYKFSSGTSMAAPVMSGAAALLLSQNPTLTNIQLKQILMMSSDKIPALSGKVASGGRLNLYKALTYRGPLARAASSTSSGSTSPTQLHSVGGIRIYDQRDEKPKW